MPCAAVDLPEPKLHESYIPRFVHALNDCGELVVRREHFSFNALNHDRKPIGDDLLGEIVALQVVAVLQDAEVAFVFLQKLEIRPGLVSEALGLYLGKIRRDDQRLMRLQPALADTDLVRPVRYFRNKMVIDQRIAERLERMRRLNEKPRALRRVPEASGCGRRT